jgi:hypothetical protein
MWFAAAAAAEAVRDDVAERVRDDLKRGAVFYDLQAKAPVRLDAFGASVKDGRGNTVSRRPQLFFDVVTSFGAWNSSSHPTSFDHR